MSAAAGDVGWGTGAAAAVAIGDENEWWVIVALAVIGPVFGAAVMALNL